MGESLFHPEILFGSLDGGKRRGARTSIAPPAITWERAIQWEVGGGEERSGQSV